MDLWSVDRIEGDAAVLIDESGNDTVVALTELPAPLKEGMMFRMVDGVYSVDDRAAQERKKTVLSLQEKLRRKRQ